MCRRTESFATFTDIYRGIQRPFDDAVKKPGGSACRIIRRRRGQRGDTLATSSVDSHSFTQWCKEKWKFIAGLVGAAAGVPIAGTTLLKVGKDVSGLIPAEALPYLLNAFGLLILVICLALLLGRAAAKRTKTTAAGTVHEFTTWWFSVWAFWLLAYILQTLLHWPMQGWGNQETVSLHQHLLRNNYPMLRAVELIPDALALAINYCFLRCYFILAHRNTHMTFGISWFVAIVLSLFLTLGVVHVLSLFLSSPGNQTKVLWLISLALLGGFIQCVSMCLLVGRLESRIISPPLAVIFLLYCYATLQLAANTIYAAHQVPSLYAMTDGEDFVQRVETVWFVCLFVALLLKVLLYVFVYWLIESGILNFYVEWMHGDGRIVGDTVRKSIDQERKEFLENWQKLQRI
jgi:hypothetical protein